MFQINHTRTVGDTETRFTASITRPGRSVYDEDRRQRMIDKMKQELKKEAEDYFGDSAPVVLRLEDIVVDEITAAVIRCVYVIPH